MKHASIERAACGLILSATWSVCRNILGQSDAPWCPAEWHTMMRVSTIAFFKLSSVVCDVTPLYQMYEAARAKQSGTWSYTHGVHGGTCKQ